jgi:NAD(P)-dependent dehydrogenase (short-subunit alcohol dehydrogenase family)
MGRQLHNLLVTAAAGSLAYWAGKRLARIGRRLDPRGKVVLITGGSRGLGLVMAREWASRGAKVAVCARNPEELNRVTDEFIHKGPDFAAIPCDLTDRADVERMVADVEDQLGPVDILLNNAGTITVGPFETMTADDFQEAMALHFWAPLYTSWAVLPSMRERGGGRIVNISSIGGKIPIPHLVPYVASKFALTGLSEAMRTELTKDNIFVTTVCPGLLRTGSPRNVGVKGRYQQEYAWFILGDSLPGASMDARRAARQVLSAALHGDAEVVLSLPAKMAVRLYGIAPELVTGLMGLQNAALLPKPPARWDSGEGARKRSGKESESPITRSFLTGLTQTAAEQNNELAADPPATPRPAGR